MTKPAFSGTAGVPAACGQDARGPGALDPRLNAYREDLADKRLRGTVTAGRYVVGQPARVVTGQAAVRANPRLGAETVTFYHFGEELRVFEMEGNFAWCQSLFDGYVGYVETSKVELCPIGTPTHFVATTGCYAYDAPDLRSPAAEFLPRHTAVIVGDTGLLTRGTEYAWLDTGLYLPLACLAIEPPSSPDIVAAAQLYLGCPYLWGGRSFLGIDCSGLIQAAFRDVGITVLRDTDMQRDTVGRRVEVTREAALRRNDLLYIPGHVMIFAGDGEVIHADGATMTVRRDNLATLMQARGLDFAGCVVRRP